MRLLLVLLILIPSSVRSELSVVTSIRPIYQITTALTKGVASPHMLIGKGDSAHHFAFRPSHFRLLQQADLVIWVNRQFESGFHKLPEVLSAKTRQLELIPALGLTTEDGHIWYSPDLLMLASAEISRVLVELDPDNQLVYQQNLAEFQQSIEDWRENVGQIIARRQPALLLDHEFLHHFEEAFGVGSMMSIHNHHDQHVGIGSLQHIEDGLRNNPVKCIVSNESSVSRTARNLAEQFSLSVRSIHSFADDGDPATRFIRHLQDFTAILRDC